MKPRALAGIPAVVVAALHLAAAEPARKAAPEKPHFSFAAIADVQYADKAGNGKRDYRGSAARLEQFVALVNQSRPAFAVQLGDLIDGGLDNLDRILPVYNRIMVPRRHVLGNHDFCTDRPALLKRLALRSAYYTFSHAGWRFIVLDGMDVSVTGGWAADSLNSLAAVNLLQQLREAARKNAVDWNGAIGAAQIEWLRKVLREAGARRERVVVFCHFPILEQASSAYHLLWNHDEVRRIIESSDSVVAFINGHDHNGGYANARGIHYVTVQGAVESGGANAFAFVDVFGDRLDLHGTGTVNSRSLKFR